MSPRKRPAKKAVLPRDETLETWARDAETYRPIGEIVAELDAIEEDARATDEALRDILKKIGVGP